MLIITNYTGDKRIMVMDKTDQLCFLLLQPAFQIIFMVLYYFIPAVID
jgi:hypothetical protein